MWRDFKAFLIKQNMLALAIAVVIGTATNNLVQAIVNDFIMPVIKLIQPGSGWETAAFPIGPVQITYGHFLSVLLNFLIVGFVCYMITKQFIKPPKPDEKPAMKPCPRCLESIDARATKCSHCTTELTPAFATA